MKYFIGYRWKSWLSEEHLEETMNPKTPEMIALNKIIPFEKICYKNQEELIEAYRNKFILRPEFDADHCPVVCDDEGKWWAIIGIARDKKDDNIKVVPFNERNDKKHWS